MSNVSSGRLATLAVIIAAGLWGVDGVLLRPTLYSLPVPTVVFIESLLATIILIPIVIRYLPELKQLKTKDWIAFGGVALFGGAIGTMAITKALFYVNFVNLSIVILIQKLQPVFTLILAAILLKERLPVYFFYWAALAIIGAYFMTFGLEFPNFTTGDKTIYAALFALLAAFSFALSTVLSKRALRNTRFELSTLLRFFFSSSILLMILLFTGDMSSIGGVSQNQWFIFILIAFTTGGAAIFLYYYGLRHISASVATICELSFPLTAILLEFFLRDNILDPLQWGGVLILMFSIYKVTGIKISKIGKPIGKLKFRE